LIQKGHTLIKFDIENLISLSNSAICSIPYRDEVIKEWERGDISFLLKSKSPQFVKDIIKHKKREESTRCKSTWYFGEAYVASILGDSTQKGWFSSFKWLYEPGWVTGMNPEHEKDPVIAKLKSEFYKTALKEYIDLDKLKILKNNWGAERPKAPDLWLIDKSNRHYLIEVKKQSDTPDKEHKQLLGLALLEKYFKMSTFIVYLYPENKNTLSIKKQMQWLKDYNYVKMMISSKI